MAFSKNWKPVPYGKEELKRFEYAPGEREEMEREADEDAACTLTWTASNGKKIAVRYNSMEEEYTVSIDNGLPKRVFEVMPMRVDGLVAKLDCGSFSIGLTAERKAILDAMAE